MPSAKYFVDLDKNSLILVIRLIAWEQKFLMNSEWKSS
jgi:hypothetical protein